MLHIAYATTHGSTAEVAEAVAKELRGEGLELDVVNAKNKRGLDSCEAIILGVPLYMFRLHKDARHKNRTLMCLAQKRICILCETNALLFRFFIGIPKRFDSVIYYIKPGFFQRF
jgi:menaquinone-dependent protoporphyrinogen IX oxidase